MANKFLCDQVEDILKAYRGNRISAEDAAKEIVVLCSQHFCDHDYFDSDIGVTCRKCGDFATANIVKMAASLVGHKG